MNKGKAKVGIALAFLLVMGTLWQNQMVKREEKQYIAVGEFLDVGSYNMHYDLKGEGEWTFLFITGSGTPCAYTDFYQLQKELSCYGKTISFDHAGFGWSSKTEEKREMDALTKELHSLVSAVVRKQRKVVLICHSLGALEAIHYAQQYPEEVSGIVFLDGGSPEFYAKDSELKSILMNRALAGIRTVGIERLLAVCGIGLPVYGEVTRGEHLTGKARGIDLAMYHRYLGNGENLDVIEHMNENATEVCNGGRLGAMPILVLSSDSGAKWQQVQEQLAFWSTSSRQRTIKGADHYLYWSNYKEVEEEITAFIEQITGHTRNR